ncbi:MAG: DUF4013 domain-containing protein [Anaerolineae bacterium]|nr:DUF4013 domain-containing protein [Anaerolineae bacterium]
MINIFEALQYPFDDREWLQKLAITMVLLFIPVLGWLVLFGYALRATRDLLRGEQGLPEFDDWAGDLARGLGATIGMMIYMIPSWIMGGMQAAVEDGILGCLACCIGCAQLIYGILILPFEFSALARYAATEDINVFLDLPGRLDDVTRHMGEVMVLVLNLVVLYVIVAIMITMGFVMCVLPGFLAIAAACLINAHMLAQWGRVLALDPYYKSKHGI